jgi:hypothetical protein
MVKGTGSSIKPYRQPFDHFFTLKTLWLKVIHDGEMAKRAAKQVDGVQFRESEKWKESGVGAPDFSSRQDPR